MIAAAPPSIYRIDSVKAKGSFSTVLVATCLVPPFERTDLRKGDTVALKCIAKANNPASIASQRREADLLIRLQFNVIPAPTNLASSTSNTPALIDESPIRSSLDDAGWRRSGLAANMAEGRKAGSSSHSSKATGGSGWDRSWMALASQDGGDKRSQSPAPSARVSVNTSNTARPAWGVVTFYEAIETDTHLIFVLEHCETDLFSLIMKTKSPDGTQGIPADIARILFQRIASAVDFCHARGIYHRDLKPENILINPSDYSVRLADFGLATDKPWSFIQACGSVRYMSPECLGVDALHRPKQNSLKLKGFASGPNDVWALGIILLNMIFAQHPWSSPGDEVCLKAYFTNGYSVATSLENDGGSRGKSLDIPSPEEFRASLMKSKVPNGFRPKHRRQMSGPHQNLHQLHQQQANMQSPTTAPKIFPSSILMGMFGASADLDATLRWCFHPDPAKRPTVSTLMDWVAAIPSFHDRDIPSNPSNSSTNLNNETETGDSNPHKKSRKLQGGLLGFIFPHRIDTATSSNKRGSKPQPSPESPKSRSSLDTPRSRPSLEAPRPRPSLDSPRHPSPPLSPRLEVGSHNNAGSSHSSPLHAVGSLPPLPSAAASSHQRKHSRSNTITHPMEIRRRIAGDDVMIGRSAAYLSLAPKYVDEPSVSSADGIKGVAAA
ncbi:hypothetical protein HDU67_008181 [Dinochytrium kinnereticum]|nr:hypothetical protein HDU67_008181 [Dinochytrium kinnereticum]